MIPEATQAARDLNDAVAQFEGLVYSTARAIVVERRGLDFDEVRQTLRLKVLYAIGKYESDRSRLDLRGFVFGAVFNMRLDLSKRPYRQLRAQVDVSIDHQREEHATAAPGATFSKADKFDMEHLSVTAEEVYAEVEDEAPEWLSRLTDTERQVVMLHSDGLTLAEVACALGLGLGQARAAMQSAREKLADLRPSAAQPRSAPMRPLPGAERRTAHPQLARAA